MKNISFSLVTAIAVAGFAAAMAPAAMAYDGQHCKAAGNCWEPKPGFPEKVAGSKYDPKHDPKELAKQSGALHAQEARNKLRADNFKKTGKWVYDVSKIQ